MSLETIYDAVLKGKAKVVAAETQSALDAGITAPAILHQAYIPAMSEVGRMFEIGEKFVPEMLIAARAMQKGLEILKPLLVEAGNKTVGKVVIGTVAGDLHDIGKNLVAMMLEGAGFQIIDLGTDVAPEKFAQTVKEQEADLVAMSALLTTTMSSIGNTIRALSDAGVRDKVKVMVGGAPVTQEFADKVGADGFAQDASSAARVAKQLIGAN